MPPSMFAQGLAHNFRGRAVDQLPAGPGGTGTAPFGGRLVFVLLVSLVAAIWSNVGDVVWWFHSPRYCLGNMAYMMGRGPGDGPGACAALVTAAPLKRRRLRLSDAALGKLRIAGSTHCGPALLRNWRFDS